jgi:hypothetical protein
MKVRGLANLHGDALRAGGYDVLVGWVLDDLGTETKPGLKPDRQGRYSLKPDQPLWFTGHPSTKRVLFQQLAQDSDPIVAIPPALEENPFDPSWGRWRDNLPGRTITDDDIDTMTTSIRERGWDTDSDRILVDEHGVIIDGRLRAAVLDKMGVDWRHDARYVAVKVYGDSPADNSRRILDALLRNGRPVTTKTTAAIAKELAAGGTSMSDIIAALGIGQRSAFRYVGEIKGARDAARRDYARRLVLDQGYSQRSAADEVARFYGGKPPNQATISRWVENGAESGESDASLPTGKNASPPSKPRSPVTGKMAKVAALADRPEGVTRKEAAATTGLANPISDARRVLRDRGEDLIATGEKRDGEAVVRRGSATPKASIPSAVAHCPTCTCFNH